MLLGTHTPKLDEKGRLVLPARLRPDLAEGVVLTKGQDRCVVLWPSAEFEKYAAGLAELSRTDAKVRAYLRVLFSSAFDQVPDKQGRISVPGYLRDYAGLTDDVVVAGNGTTCEMWQVDAWEEYLAGQEAAFAQLDGEVMPGVL